MTSLDTPANPEQMKAIGAETHHQRHAKRVLPWLTSVAAHALLILIGFLIPWTTRFFFADSDEPVAIVADFDQLTPGTLALNDVSPEGTQSSDESLQLSETSVSLPTFRTESQAETAVNLDLAGPSIESDVMRGFTPAGSGDSVSFGGLRGSNARNIVYVVDASGSMMPYLSIVIDELIRSIDQLGETQNFAVIFFQNNEAILVPGPDDRASGARRRRGQSRASLLPATLQNKLFVYDWIDLDHNNIRATGKSNPLEAIELAVDGLSPQPDVIFILSTDITGVGEFEVDQRELLNMIDRLNSDRHGMPKAIIKTIQFIDHDPLETLKKIAERNGGEDGYIYLSREDLGLN